MANMVNRLEAAVAAYQRAQEAEADAKIKAMAKAKAEMAAAHARTDEARRRLATAIVQASESGMRQREIVAVTGYTRERVRQILRAAGL